MSDQSDPKTREDKAEPQVGEEQTEVFVPEDAEESQPAATEGVSPATDVSESEVSAAEGASASEAGEPPVHEADEAETSEASAAPEPAVGDRPPSSAEVTSAPDEQAADTDVFSWHPEYAGQHADQVRQDLAQQIASDQRQHALAMEGAEEAEHDALVSVVELERKWGVYDFDWAEQDANALASRIVAFEQERERRRELISWSEYRTENADEVAGGYGDPPAAELSTGIKAVSLLLVVLLIVVILLAVWAL